MTFNSRLTFKEYLDSKKKLKIAGDDYPRFILEYTVTKYCKIPVYEMPGGDEDRIYISLKPKDNIKIFWEKADFVRVRPTYLLFEEDGIEMKYYPAWSSKKLSDWISATTTTD